MPSQSVQVPAGHTYKLNWVLNTGTASGTSKLTSQVSARVPYKIDAFTGEESHMMLEKQWMLKMI